MTNQRSLPTLALATLALAAALSTGCGYALAGRASNLPQDIRRIYVETLKNETPRSQVEQILTQAISEELVTRRRFNVVNSAGDADAILRGKVLSFTVRPLTFDEAGLATNFEIAITADMSFRRHPTPDDEEGEVLWSNSRYVFRQDYPLEEESVPYFDRENLAIEETSTRFAETMVTDLLEGF
jgi:outer membrane lipopolysaccharide assembly protein LptE/RlpB